MLPAPPFPMQLLAPFPFKATQPSSPHTEPPAPMTEPENEEDSMDWCLPPPSHVPNIAISKKGNEPQHPKASTKKQKAAAGGSR